MNKYLFETEQFGFTNNKLVLLRSRYPYRTVAFNEIIKSSIIKGIAVKRPILVLVFGSAMVIASIYIVLFTTGLLDNLQTHDSEGSSFRGYKTFGYSLVMGGFLMVFGAIAIYQATFPIWILKVHLLDDTSYKFSIRKLINNDEIHDFTQLLKKNFPQSHIEIDRRLVR